MIEYNKTVPWERSYTEYGSMFNLTPDYLSKKVLGCGNGPAAFNAVATAFGNKVTSVDPIYYLSQKEIEKRIEETFTEVINQTKANMDKFNWEQFGTIEGLGKIRMKSMKQFLNLIIEKYPNCELVKVNYEFQKGGNQMLVIKEVEK